MTRKIHKRKKFRAPALIIAVCLALAALSAAVPAFASEIRADDGAANSGLLYLDYTARDKNNRVLTDIFGGDQFTLDVRFEKPESIDITGDIKAQMTGGVFDGAVNSVSFNASRSMVTVSFSLTYGGSRSKYIMFNLSGSRSIGGGPAASFNEPWNIAVAECRPDEAGADVIRPDAPYEPPKFAVDLSAKFAVADAGKKYAFDVPVKNIGKQAAKNVTVSIEAGEGPDFPFEYDRYAFTTRIAEIDANAVKNVRFEVKTLPTAKNGQHTLTLKFTGSAVLGVGAPAESSDKIMLTVKNVNTAPRLILERISLSGSAPAAGTSAGAAADGGAGTDGADGANARNGGVIEVLPGPQQTIDVIKPGSKFTLTLYIKNTGTLVAKDVVLTLKGLKADGILTDNAPDVRQISSIDGQSGGSQSFDLICSESMLGERVELSLAASYKDESGKEYASDSQVFIPLTQSKKKASHSSFEFAKVSAPTGQLGEGNDFRISFDIVNTGDVPMENIKLTYTAGSEFIGKTLNTQMIKEIAPGASLSKSFDFTVAKINMSGNFAIQFTCEYSPGDPDDGEDGGAGSGSGGAVGGQGAARLNASQYVGVLLFKPEETTTTTTSTTTEGKESVPKIIVSNYLYEPKEAKAGQTVDITLTFFNTSMTQDVKNIKIQLDSDTTSSSGTYGGSSGVFTPVEGSNSFYIERIGARQEENRSIKLMIRGDAEAKSYQLFANIEYEDSKSAPITTKESISIPVTQVTKLTINDVMINSPQIMLFQPFGISYSFINMGKTTLYNVVASVEGDFTSPVQTYYAGNMTPGMQDYFDTTIVAGQEGEQTSYALITYEDAVGNIFEERKEFTYAVMQMPDFGGDMMMNGEGMPPPMEVEMGAAEGEGVMKYVNIALTLLRDPKKAVAAGVAVLVIIIAIAGLARRRRNKRLERELNRAAELEIEAIARNGEPGGGQAGRGGGYGGGGNAVGSGGGPVGYGGGNANQTAFDGSKNAVPAVNGNERDDANDIPAPDDAARQLMDALADRDRNN